MKLSFLDVLAIQKMQRFFLTVKKVMRWGLVELGFKEAKKHGMNAQKV